MPNYVLQSDFQTYGLTINKLLGIARQYHLPYDTPIYIQHVEDVYVENHQEDPGPLNPDDHLFDHKWSPRWSTIDLPCEQADSCPAFQMDSTNKNKLPKCCQDCPDRNRYIQGQEPFVKEGIIFVDLHI